jgi:hypothetical protein
MRVIHSWMNLSRFSVVASALFGGASQEASVAVEVEVVVAAAGSADAVLAAEAINTVKVDETTSASTRL